MKARLLAVSVILFAGLSAAQTQNSTVGAEPGLVKADGFLYGLDVAVDNALVAAGFRSPGDVAFERASEVAVAEERNNTEALQKASERFSEAVERADNSDRGMLEQAESVLNNVSERVPEEADFGISTALENVEAAKNRVPDRLTSEGAGALPDIKMPGTGGRDVESPTEAGEG